MFDYLQQFNKLPQDLRDQVSSPSAMAVIADLEAQYKVDLAIVIMKVMVKIIPITNLALHLSEEFSLLPETAQKLANDLKEKVFASVAEYLGLTESETAFNQDQEIEKVIAEAGLLLPSSLAIDRFKNIISTYNRGIRNKIDTKNTLGKSYKIGGLDLSPEEIERVLKICDSRFPQNSIKAPLSSISNLSASTTPSSRLDKIIASADNLKRVSEYDLRQAISTGQVKKIAAPKEELKKISAREEVKKIAAPEPEVKKVAAPTISPVIPPVVHPVIQRKEAESVKAVKAIKAIKTEAPAKPMAASRPAAPVAGTKKIIQDVKPVPKVMGPIEELQFLDLVNFRRLGKTAAESTAKIFSKIKLLEAEGYDKMIAGVRAWRQSPVNRLYLKMGREAIRQGVPLKDFVDFSEKNNENYLKLEEIEAIITLNSKLIF